MRARVPLLASAVLGVALVAACGTNDPAGTSTVTPGRSADREDAYLAVVREHTDDSTDETVIQMGVHLCRELEEGRVSQRDAVAWLMNEYPDDISVIPTITIFGIEALCPEWYR